MDRNKMSNHHGYFNRRSFLHAAGVLAAGAALETMLPGSARSQQSSLEIHPTSARVLDRWSAASASHRRRARYLDNFGVLLQEVNDNELSSLIAQFEDQPRHAFSDLEATG